MVTSAPRVLEALSDTTRRKLFERLVEAPLTVQELFHRSAVSRPAVSQHLKILRKAGLATALEIGGRRVYRANLAGLAPLRAYLDGLFDRGVVTLERAVDGAYATT